MCCFAVSGRNILTLRKAFFQMVVDPIAVYKSTSTMRRTWASNPKLCVAASVARHGLPQVRLLCFAVPFFHRVSKLQPCITVFCYGYCQWGGSIGRVPHWVVLHHLHLPVNDLGKRLLAHIIFGMEFKLHTGLLRTLHAYAKDAVAQRLDREDLR